MILIHHRRNTIQQLNATSLSYGVEIDLRSNNGEIILHHDPFFEGVNLNEWIKHFKHRTLILNVKEEGLEERLIKTMEEHNVLDYFFLDQSFPFLLRYADSAERRSAVRFSEYESIETVISLKNIVNWVWVDCFSKFPLNKSSYQELKGCGFRLCFVSPELQGFEPCSAIRQHADIMIRDQILPDAICTKFPQHWEELIGQV